METPAYTIPSIPGYQAVLQKMVDIFGPAGAIAIAIIGGTVALGALVILGMYGWRMIKKWLASAK